MQTRNLLTVVAAAAVAVFAQGTFAQTTSTSPSRAEVKAETRAAEKAGKLAPAGQGPGAMSSGASAGMSDKSRATGKSETKAARAEGNLKPAGEASEMKDDKKEKMARSTKTRDERKAQTRADVKSRSIQPAGEAAQPAAEPPKK